MRLETPTSRTTRKRPLKLGLCLPTHGPGFEPISWSEILDLAVRGADAGFDSLWVNDHFLTRGAPGQDPAATQAVGYWECFSVLTALAVAVPGLELGTLVAGTGYRNPALLAKIADTLDEISGGRFVLGLGAGDCEWEHLAFGYPFDHQVGRFEEAIKVVKGLLRNGPMTFNGAYHRVDGAELKPRGPRPQGPPIMIGTLNPKPRMQRLVAQYADIWNAWLVLDSHPDVVVEQQSWIDAACARYERDPGSLVRTAVVQVVLPSYPSQARRVGRPIAGTHGEIANGLRRYARAGITHVQVLLQPQAAASVTEFGAVVAELEADAERP